MEDEDFSQNPGSDDDLEDIESNAEKHFTFTFDYLFKKILEYCEDNALKRIEQIVAWKMKSSESILKSLLMNNLD